MALSESLSNKKNIYIAFTMILFYLVKWNQ